MSSKKIDHLDSGVPDLDAAVERLERRFRGGWSRSTTATSLEESFSPRLRHRHFLERRRTTELHSRDGRNESPTRPRRALRP
jgi:hypothetical protein